MCGPLSTPRLIPTLDAFNPSSLCTDRSLCRCQLFRLDRSYILPAPTYWYWFDRPLRFPIQKSPTHPTPPHPFMLLLRLHYYLRSMDRHHHRLHQILPGLFWAMSCVWWWWAMMAWSRTLVIENRCAETVWPGILSGAGTPPLNDSSDTGFELAPGSERRVMVWEKWSGRVWARTGCGGGEGNFWCETGDCGTKGVECGGAGAEPPATLVEMTLEGSGGKDFYDVSLVDGYNVGAAVVPSNGTCEAVVCAGDINAGCPSELVVKEQGKKDGHVVVACKSACLAFRTPIYCCSGNYSSPSSCQPSSFSLFFKSQCPSSYSYAFDDASSTFTCPSSPSLLYTLTFCPPPSSSSSSSSSFLSSSR